MDTLELARQTRRAIELYARAAPDEIAAQIPMLFEAWSGDGVAYAKDDRRQFNRLLYRCITAHTSQADWTPDVAVSLWVRIDNPADEWPVWRQPTGATDAYRMAAKVSHNGKHWVSDVDNNVWEPGVYGWTETQ